MKSADAEGLLLVRCAAIYARKSTKEKDRGDENKSTKRQIERAKAYAASKGWTVRQEHIYEDDGISGAEFENRKGFARLIADLPKRGKPPFDVLIMSEASRLGRDQQRTGYFLAHIRDAGVRIFYYLDDAEERLDTPEQVLMSSVKSYASEVERMKAGQRSRDALALRAARGYNAGGKCYGYDNVRGTTHTEFAINPEQAEVIRRIFTMYAAGYGPRSIAKTLNGDPSYAVQSRRFFSGERPPKPVEGKRGSGSWAPTAIRGMLRNERYTGVLTYGERMKCYRMGTKQRKKQPNSKRIIRVERADLRIVPEELWSAVQKRIAAERRSYLQSSNGQLHGRPETGRDSRYMLSGLVRCGGCDSSMVASSQPHGSGATRKSVRCFVCSYRSNRGSTACSNALRPREEVLNREVLAAMGEVLNEDVLRKALRQAVARHRDRSKADRDAPERKRRELSKLEAERNRLVAAIRMGGGRLESLVPVLTDCEARVEALRHELAQLAEPATVAMLSDKRFEQQLVGLAARWQDWIGKHPALARNALRAMLVGPVKLLPTSDGYRLTGVSRLGALFENGAANANRVEMASRRGFEPRLPP